jgi:hypothetical protein
MQRGLTAEPAAKRARTDAPAPTPAALTPAPKPGTSTKPGAGQAAAMDDDDDVDPLDGAFMARAPSPTETQRATWRNRSDIHVADAAVTQRLWRE